MKETRFISENKNKWAKFERSRQSSETDPDETRKLYTEINNDLSYAQTFYKKRTVRAYLNYLAQEAHRRLYKQKKEPFSSVWSAWTIEIPLAIYRARKNLLFALVLFIVYATIGAFSTHQDVNFARSILGSNYINITEENIASGDPLGIYGTGGQSSMFIQITLNNIKVALMCFFGGILFSLGTHVILFNNAVMVGVFQYFFKLKGLLLTSFLTIWIHGAFEISAIVIASGAGFTLGHGLLFPGSYTRLQALQMSGMRGIRIMLSLIPIFTLAGFLESFVTRNYQVLPEWSKWLIVLFSFGIVLFYYVVYPMLVARKYPEKIHETPKVEPFKKQHFNLHKIRKNAEVLRDTFQHFRAQFYSFWKVTAPYLFPSIVLIAIYQNVVHWNDLQSFYYFDWATQCSILFGNPYSQVFNGTSDIVISFLWLVPLTFCGAGVFYTFDRTEKAQSCRGFYEFLRRKGGFILLGLIPLHLIFFFVPYYFQIPLIFLLPLLFLLPASAAYSNNKNTLSEGFNFGAKHWTNGFIVLLVLSLGVFFMAQPFGFVLSIHENAGTSIMRDVLDWFLDFLQPILMEITEYHTAVINLLRQLVYTAFFILLLPLFFIASSFIYFSAREEIQATGLYKQFKQFGKRSKTQESPADYE
ncbi:MAG: stage II sporulation protein M [Bacteroidota bacterium]